MSRLSSMLAEQEAVDSMGRKIGKRAGRRQSATREVHGAASERVGKRLDYSHDNPTELLGKFWEFAKNPMSGIAAVLVSTAGAAMALLNVQGFLKDAVLEAEGLQKARGRNIKPDVVAEDLGIDVPSGYTPTFDLYLQVIGVRPETDQDRTIARAIKTAIRRKIREVRKPIVPEEPATS